MRGTGRRGYTPNLLRELYCNVRAVCLAIDPDWPTTTGWTPPLGEGLTDKRPRAGWVTELGHYDVDQGAVADTRHLELRCLCLCASENMAIACFVDYLTLMPTYGFLFLII